MSTDEESMESFSLNRESSKDVLMKPQYFATVKKVREIIKIFRKSPVKNDDVLQKYVRENNGKELSLISDCKTRWNSLFAMLKRFYELRIPVQKAMIDLKGQVKVNVTDDEMELVKEMLQALEPINAAVEHLCRQQCTLYEADVALHFMLEQLTSQGTNIALELCEALIDRIKERRFEYADLYASLFNPSVKTSITNNFGIFFKTSRSALIIQAEEMLKRLNTEETVKDAINELSSNVEESVDDDDSDNLTIKEKFERRLLQLKAAAPVSTNSMMPGFQKTMRNEFTYLETEGIRGKYLTMLFEALSTVRPTSVDAERAFSVSGNFATKIRSRMGDNTLNMLCVLKSYFCNQTK